MTATAELIETVKKATSTMEEFKKVCATKAELKEHVDKFAADLNAIQEQAKKAITRIGTPGEPDANGVAKLIKRGVKKMAYGSSVKADVERFLAANALGTMFEVDHRGIMTNRKRWEEEEIKVLELAELVQLADALQAGADPDWGYKKARGGEREVFMARFPKIGAMWDQVHEQFQKAAPMDTTTANQGIDWIPTGFSSTLRDQVRLACPEENLFAHVPMPTATWKWPFKNANGSYNRKGENANATVTIPTTTNITFTAQLGAYYTSWTDEIAEDSIIAILPMLRADAIRAISEGKSRAIISGRFVTLAGVGTHIDTDYEAAAETIAEKMLYGLRNYALAGTDLIYDAGTLAPMTSTIIATAAGKMGKYAAGRLGSLVALVGTTSWLNLLLDTNMQTVDKFGPNALILTGQVGSVYGIPIVMSHGVQTRCGATGAATGVTGATGVNDGGANTSGTAVLVNREAWLIGDYRNDTFEQDKNIVSGVNTLVVTNRWDFEPLYQPANYPNTHDATTEPHTLVITDIAK